MSVSRWAEAARSAIPHWRRRLRRAGSSPVPVVHLHIGRNKVGSTTLQDFFLERRQDLEAQGVRYVLFGHLKDSVPGVAGFGHQDELAAYARANPGTRVLVSNEFMFGWPAEYTAGMVAGLRGLDARVIAYIRPYDSWVCSSYAQDVRNGESLRDFDRYFDWLRPRVSAWPYLDAWGEGLGWDKVRVRSIDGVGLTWDDLVPDCLAAVGLDPGVGTRAAPSNRAPHWATIELLRKLVDRNLEEAWDEAKLAVVLPLRREFEASLAQRPDFGPRIQYLTPAQHRELVELYNRDVAAITRRTGDRLALQPVSDLAVRPFLPAFERVPPAIVKDFAARVLAPDFIASHPAAAAAAARSLGLA